MRYVRDSVVNPQNFSSCKKSSEVVYIDPESIVDGSSYRSSYELVSYMLQNKSVGSLVDSPKLFFDSDKGYDPSLLDNVSYDEVLLRTTSPDPSEKIAIAERLRQKLEKDASKAISDEVLKASVKKNRKKNLAPNETSSDVAKQISSGS